MASRGATKLVPYAHIATVVGAPRPAVRSSKVCEG